MGAEIGRLVVDVNGVGWRPFRFAARDPSALHVPAPVSFCWTIFKILCRSILPKTKHLPAFAVDLNKFQEDRVHGLWIQAADRYFDDGKHSPTTRIWPLRHWKCLFSMFNSTYRPFLVTIISLVSSWNLDQSSRSSRATRHSRSMPELAGSLLELRNRPWPVREGSPPSAAERMCWCWWWPTTCCCCCCCCCCICIPEALLAELSISKRIPKLCWLFYCAHDTRHQVWKRFWGWKWTTRAGSTDKRGDRTWRRVDWDSAARVTHHRPFYWSFFRPTGSLKERQEKGTSFALTSLVVPLAPPTRSPIGPHHFFSPGQQQQRSISFNIFFTNWP